MRFSVYDVASRLGVTTHSLYEWALRYDNALPESFFRHLKRERFKRKI